MKFVGILLLQSIFYWTVLSLPCLTNKSKKDFDKARNALKGLESFLRDQATTINNRVKALDKDMIDMEADFKRRQWLKYNDHCYFFGIDKVVWTEAERKCREIGGHLVKIDDSSEDNWLYQQMKKARPGLHFWTGMTDVVNGDWRWIYDQTQPSFKNFYSGHPLPTSNTESKDYNCMFKLPGHSGQWHDYRCSYKTPYICESNFCFS